MMKKLKTQFVITLSLLALIVALGVGGVASTKVSADCPKNPSVSEKLTAGVNGANTGAADDCVTGGVTDTNKTTGVSESNITKLAKEVTNILSIVIGAISVIMIIIGGFLYVTSSGTAEKVGKAKSTIIYALVGLVIVVLAQTIVHFVLNRTINATTPTTSYNSNNGNETITPARAQETI